MTLPNDQQPCSLVYTQGKMVTYVHTKTYIFGIPWQSSGSDSVLSLPEPWFSSKSGNQDPTSCTAWQIIIINKNAHGNVTYNSCNKVFIIKMWKHPNYPSTNDGYGINNSINMVYLHNGKLSAVEMDEV